MDLWQFRGECGNHDPEIWFPVSSAHEASARAKAICLTCPVRSQCLAYAQANAISEGVWGGLTGFERSLLSARERRAHNYIPPDQVEHGTSSGYAWHRRYDRPACEACLAAERDRGAVRRAAEQQEKASA